MKQMELRKHAACSFCGEKVLARGVPLFWRVTIERFGIDLAAVNRQAGLEMMLGSPMLALHMGPDETMAKPVMDPVTLTMCEGCAIGHIVPIAALAERTTIAKVD